MKKYWKDQLTLLLTGACDAKCAHCAVKRRSDGKIGIDELERNVFPHITPFHEIALCGGEPTIHPKFREIVEGALARTKSVSIVTNGACVSTEKRAAEFLEFLGEHPELTVFFSADTQHEEGVPDFSERLRRLVDSGLPNIGFKVTEPSQIECRDTIERLGLPEKRTITSLLWEEDRLHQFGTEKRVFISETGGVHNSMSDYLNRKRPIGSIAERRLDDILNETDY